MKNKAFMLLGLLVLAACGCQSTNPQVASANSPACCANPAAATKPPWPPPSPNTMNYPPPSAQMLPAGPPSVLH